MPHMKYFQSLAYIEDHLKEVIFNLENDKWNYENLKEIYNKEELENLKNELRAIKFLKNMQFGKGFHEKEILFKPEIEVMNNCLNRHLIYIDKVFNVKQDTLKTNDRFPFIVKEFKACKHYLFQFTKRVWYEKLPKRILPFESNVDDFKVIIDD